MRHYFIIPAVFLLFFYGFGCTALKPGYDPVVVNVTSFKMLPAKGMVPRLSIGLSMINPNRFELNPVGLSYTVRIEDHKIFTGVSNNLPVIPAYGQKDLLLEGDVNLFGSFRFITDLMTSQNRAPLSYRVDVKLDTGTLGQVINVSKKGDFRFLSP